MLSIRVARARLPCGLEGRDASADDENGKTKASCMACAERRMMDDALVDSLGLFIVLESPALGVVAIAFSVAWVVAGRGRD